MIYDVLNRKSQIFVNVTKWCTAARVRKMCSSTSSNSHSHFVLAKLFESTDVASRQMTPRPSPYFRVQLNFPETFGEIALQHASEHCRCSYSGVGSKEFVVQHSLGATPTVQHYLLMVEVGFTASAMLPWGPFGYDWRRRRWTHFPWPCTQKDPNTKAKEERVSRDDQPESRRSWAAQFETFVIF